MDEIIKSDLDYIYDSKIVDFGGLNGKTILVTGATGLIGFNLVIALAYCGYDVKVIALIRNIEKATKMYAGFHIDKIKFITSDVTAKIQIDDDIDYIIHTASQTSSKAFVEEPVETIATSIEGTKNILCLAKQKKVKGCVYLSSMEVYGAPSTDEKIKENHSANIDTMMVRSSYPESKRMCETLCKAYQSEYNVPVMILRLTQTFGYGVTYNDGRVFAEFARCAIEKKNILLHTKGETKRNYLYTADAVTAILTVMLKGESGKAYNAANEATYCSIYQMAEMVANHCTDGEIGVVIDVEDINSFGYAPILKMNLDTNELKKLGWHAEIGLPEMYDRLIMAMVNKCG